MLRKIISTTLVAAFSVTILGAITGCNTVEGVGKDIERGGAAIKNEAQEQKSKG